MTFRPRTPASSRGISAVPAATPRSRRRPSTVHPVEVLCRIRNLVAGESALDVIGGGTAVRALGHDGCCHHFALDGASSSEQEDLEWFYRRLVRPRVERVRGGARCTVLVYGPTGSGKSHTMFGSAREPGIVHRALWDILEEGQASLSVRVTVLEIHDEKVYDLLAESQRDASKTKMKLDVMGKKARNAAYITGNEADQILRHIAKVEKRRTVKSTLCNERSSRSHCMIILDVPSVGGRLMLVDMAGSENIEATGQTGSEAKMQTGKINQGNASLKRVVESIADGEAHIPYRDSKLTMLLQDSFEDQRSKVVMILCVSPDIKELHKSISTLAYGAKAKCIVRAVHAAVPRERMTSEESSSILNSKVAEMNQFIEQLQQEKMLMEKERNEALNLLRIKEEELAKLRAKPRVLEGQGSASKEEVVIEKVQQILSTKLTKRKQEFLDCLKDFLNTLRQLPENQR